MITDRVPCRKFYLEVSVWIEFTTIVVAVSYTHLDVYKRQIFSPELKKLQRRVSKTAFSVGLNRGDVLNGEKISEFFENRLSKLRFLSLLVMRGFL